MIQSIAIVDASTHQYGGNKGQHDIPHKPTLSRLRGRHTHIVNHLLFRRCMVEERDLPPWERWPFCEPHPFNETTSDSRRWQGGSTDLFLYVCQFRRPGILYSKMSLLSCCEGVTAKSLLQLFSSARRRRLPDMAASWDSKRHSEGIPNTRLSQACMYLLVHSKSTSTRPLRTSILTC